MKPYFGKLTPQKTFLVSAIGRRVIEEWTQLSIKYPDLNLEIDSIRVLPNHVHALLIIGANRHNLGNNPFSFPDTTIVKLDQEKVYNDRAYRFTNSLVMDAPGISPQSSIISVISDLKETISQYAKLHHLDFEWAAGFHDHIVRNTDEFLRIRSYILRNIHKHHYKKFLENLRGDNISVNGVAFSTLGNRALLTLPKTGFLCSRDISDAGLDACIHWAKTQIIMGSCVVCGEHGRIEKAVFDTLLNGTQPLILLLARGITRRLPKRYWDQINADRLLVLSSFPDTVERVVKATAMERNENMVAITNKIIIGYKKEKGQLAELINSNPEFDFQFLNKD